jgi:hypothetical protein
MDIKKSNIIYKILNLNFEILSDDELKKRFSDTQILSDSECESLFENIKKLNPKMIFVKYDHCPGHPDFRVSFYNSVFKYSTVISKRKITSKNLNTEMIYPYIYKTKIVNGEEVVVNLIKTNERYVIVDEEILINDWFLENDSATPIEDMIKEIFNVYNDNAKPYYIDEDVFIFESKKYFYFKIINKKFPEYILNAHYNQMVKLPKEESTFKIIDCIRNARYVI